MNKQALLDMEELLKEGTWPDGYSPDKQENHVLAAQKHRPRLQAPDACQDGAKGAQCQARNLTTLPIKALRPQSCRPRNSDCSSLHARLWHDVNRMLVPAISHVFWGQFTRIYRKLKVCTTRNAVKLRQESFWTIMLARRSQEPYLKRSQVERDRMAGACHKPRVDIVPVRLGGFSENRSQMIDRKKAEYVQREQNGKLQNGKKQ